MSWGVPTGAGRPVPRSPFGLVVAKGNQVPEQMLARARELGVAYIRPPDVILDDWARGKGKCAECARLKASKKKLVLTVRANGRSGEGKGRAATTPPKDFFEYRKGIAEVVLAYEPEILVIENEEDSSSYYYDGTKYGTWDSLDDGRDTAEKYAEQIAAACAVTRKLRKRCANGGLSSHAVALLTWADYIKTGRTDAACDFAKRAFYTRWNANEGERFCKVTSLDTIPPEPRKEISRRKRLLDVYRMSKLDYVNFHWYVRDAKAFGETVRFLRKATGKPVITNELGFLPWDEDPAAMPALLGAAGKLGLTVAVWHSISSGGIASLVDPEGKLRAPAEAFSRAVRTKY